MPGIATPQPFPAPGKKIQWMHCCLNYNQTTVQCHRGSVLPLEMLLTRIIGISDLVDIRSGWESIVDTHRRIIVCEK